MRRLHRYYFSEVLLSSALTFCVLFGVLTVSLVYRGIDKAQGGGLIDAVVITMLWTIDAFPDVLGIALLFGTIATFARAAADREITAIMAAGLSLRLPVEAALLVGLPIAALGGLCQHYLIPWAHYYKFRVVAEAMREFLIHTRPTGDQMTLDDFAMTWDREEGGHFRDVVLFVRDEVLLAESAWFEVENDTVSLRMRAVQNPANGLSVEAPTLSRDLREMGTPGRRSDDDRDVTSDRLLAEVYRGGHPNPNGAGYTLHRRSCYALLPCLLVPIGVCIGVMARERGRATAMALGLIPVMCFYAADFIGLQLVRQWNHPLMSVLSGYLPTIVLLVGGVPFCWRTLRS